MKIVHKLTLGFLSLTALIWVMGFVVVDISEEALEHSIIDGSQSSAKSALAIIDRHVYQRLDILGACGYDRKQIDAIELSNTEFGDLEDVQAYIDKSDREWTSVPENARTPLMTSILGSASSNHLSADADYHGRKNGHFVFGEMFTTNEFGALVASTIRTSDYRQDDEEWWLRAKAEGFYVGDLSVDESSGTYSLALSVRIEDSHGTFMGVIKGVLAIDDVIDSLEELTTSIRKRYGQSTQYTLVSGDARTVYSTEKFTPLETVPEHILSLSEIRDAENTSRVDDHGANDGELIVHVHSKGYRDFQGLHWSLVLRHMRSEVFGPVTKLRKAVTWLTIAITGLALGMGVVLSRAIARRITELGDATRQLAGGDLSTRVHAKGSDEVAELARCFNMMATDLEASRREVSKHTLALERSNRELQDFAHVASHDLQEPLRKVHAFGDRLVAKFGDVLGDQGRDYVERMQSATRRMKTLINDLLTFSRVSSKARPFQQVDLGEIADTVLCDLEVSIEESGGKVEVGELPTIDADPTQIRQVVQNLVGNALKFHKPNETPSVIVHCDPNAGDDDMCRVIVQDNGIGFDEKYSDRIFGVFQRLHGRKEFEGSGMGLAVVRKIVERHGGSVEVNSKPGEGATFVVTLPKKHKNTEAEQQEEENEECNELESPLQS